MKKRLLSFVIALFLILSLPLPVLTLAAQEAKMIQSVQIEGTDMQIICADAEPGEGQYRVALDGKELPVTNVTVRREQIPVTVFCLVDMSGSISDYKMKLIRETLLEISASMGEHDNMVIATLGNGVQVGPVLYTEKERAAAIEALAVTKEDTNLYAGIVQCMELLVSDTNYNSYGCLVVLSDGVDDQDNGMTEQEVMNAIQAARRPLYTVALIQDTPELEGGKVMGSFARSSYGGVHQSTVKEGGGFNVRWDATGAEFGSTIWNSLQGMTVLHADLTAAQIDFQKTEVRLDVTFLAGSNTYSDYTVIGTNTLPGAPVPPPTGEILVDPPEVFETTESVPATTTAGDTPGSNGKLILWIGIGAALILVAVIILLVIRRRNDQSVQPEPPGRTFNDALGPTMGMGNTDMPATEPGDGMRGAPRAPAKEKAPLQQKFRVQLTDIPHGLNKKSFTVKAVEVSSFGRDKNKSQYLLSTEDNKLSGKHFSLILQKDSYLIQDEKSTNGTFLNGLPIAGKGWVKLHSGDKVRAGGYEYRVTIEPEN